MLRPSLPAQDMEFALVVLVIIDQVTDVHLQFVHVQFVEVLLGFAPVQGLKGYFLKYLLVRVVLVLVLR